MSCNYNHKEVIPYELYYDRVTETAIIRSKVTALAEEISVSYCGLLWPENVKSMLKDESWREDPLKLIAECYEHEQCFTMSRSKTVSRSLHDLLGSVKDLIKNPQKVENAINQCLTQNLCISCFEKVMPDQSITLGTVNEPERKWTIHQKCLFKFAKQVSNTDNMFIESAPMKFLTIGSTDFGGWNRY